MLTSMIDEYLKKNPEEAQSKEIIKILEKHDCF